MSPSLSCRRRSNSIKVIKERVVGAGYNMLYRAVGGVWCTRIGMIAVIPTALLIPLATIYGRHPFAVQAHLFFSMAVNAFADTNAYSGSNVLVRQHPVTWQDNTHFLLKTRCRV